MVFIQNVWWLLVLIGIMIMIHELGHYWAARFFDVRVEAFSFGFGPRLFGFRKGETDFRFSAILFGGYVKMTGEQPGEETASDPRAFSSKPRWQRLIIAAAGPAMNIILAVGVLTGLFMFRFPRPANAHLPATIGYLRADSPAAKVGMQEGDRIVQIDDVENPVWEDVIMKEIASPGRQVSVTVERNGERRHYLVTPVLDDKTGVGSAGWDDEHPVQIGGLLAGMDAEKKGLKRGDILIAVDGKRVRSTARLHDIIRGSDGRPVEVVYKRDGKEYKTTVTPSYADQDGGRYMLGVQLERPVVFTALSFPDALRESIRQNVRMGSMIFKLLQGIIERRMSPKSLEGPIRIAQLSGEAAREGPLTFFLLMTNVSLNLAIFNLLPIPILDGGLILLLLVEMIMRRDLSLQFKETVFKLGMVFLMLVVVFVLYNDISKILPG
ncbi:MAG TPA: RIP metalloprotease RseP [Bryobacteraceae bacterium]|nr:RIP metalloprotease RseP [Bryobacteraceae bacterium]